MGEAGDGITCKECGTTVRVVAAELASEYIKEEQS